MNRNKMILQPKGRRCLLAALSCIALWLCGCTVKSSYPEVEQYLKSRFGGKFRIEEVTENGDVYYQVTQADGEKLSFKVYPVGDEYTRSGFDDTCPVVFVTERAQEAGLVLEPGDSEKELITTIQGFEEMEGLAETLAGIADAYREAELPAKFTEGTVGEGWNCADIRIQIQGFSPEGYQPCVVRIPDSMAGFRTKEEIQQYLESNYLTYLSCYSLEELPGDIPEDALATVNGETNGITLEYEDRAVEYPDLDYNNLYFAQVYRMAGKEGWEIEAEDQAFTITSNEQDFRFEIDFEETEEGQRSRLGSGLEPAVYWYPPDGAGRAPASYEYAQSRATISPEILEQIIGVQIHSGLKLQEKQERSQEIQEEVNGYLLRSDIKQPGESAEILNWRVTLMKAEERKRIESSSMYFDADEGKVFLRLDMEVENLGDQKESFLKTIATQDDLLIHLITSGGHRYIPVDLIGMTDLTSVSLEPGETKSGCLVFHIAEEIPAEDDDIFLALKAGEKSQIFRIK